MPILTNPCFPQSVPDPETGCRSCSDNARTDYEQCRQAFFLKQQNQILQSQKGTELTSQNLNTENQNLQSSLDTQQKQIQTLTQQVNSQNQRVNTLTNQLNTSNIINISLAVMLGLVLIFGIFIFIKNYGKHKIISKK